MQRALGASGLSVARAAVLAALLVASCDSAAPVQRVDPARAARAVEQVRESLTRTPLTPRERADGMTQVHVERGSRHATMVVRQPNGERRARCVDDPEQAAHLLEGSE